MKRLFAFSICLLSLSYWCSGQALSAPPKVSEEKSQFSLYTTEDSTLTSRTTPVIMPYNRLINPAGTTVYFGDPAQENHALDATLMPDKKTIVVEDRFGIALFDLDSRELLSRFSFNDSAQLRGFMSTFSGIKIASLHDSVYIFWSAAKREQGDGGVMQAFWDGNSVKLIKRFRILPVAPADLSLPNEIEIKEESGVAYLYVVLNGNNSLEKIRIADEQLIWACATGVAPFGLTIVGNSAYVSNWGGPIPADSTTMETAGVPWGAAFVSPTTGATAKGTVSVVDIASGKLLKEIEVGLHPNAIIQSPDQKQIYVANGNSDNISVINTSTNEVQNTIPVSALASGSSYIGSTPNGLAMDPTGSWLFVANGMDNAIAMISVAPSGANASTLSYTTKGYIPTQAYPSSIVYHNRELVVTNLEAIGARVNSSLIVQENGKSILVPRGLAFNAHRELASLSFIPIPDAQQLASYTQKVKELNFAFREKLARQLPRGGVAPKPMPERIGEPSVFKHVLYVIKENRTYDQVLGDMNEGRGDPSLCIYGDSATPNQHQLARSFELLDNYYASGKSSAEGHQWTDAAFVTDYIEKSVRGWFRSYPHAQYDAMVYDKEGFIWNNALDHGKSVRIYGEACRTQIPADLNWTKVWELYQQKKPVDCKNISTISRVRPILSQSYPGYDDPRINDQLRADAFIKELHEFEQQPGDRWPQLMVMSLPNDHNAGLTPGYPTPRAMVADNDLALARIVEAVSASRFWSSTVIFVTEDDSQSGWDHISAYRTTGFVISPYSALKRTIHTQYNQTSMVRSIEQILGLPPMTGLDATALPMFDCFEQTPDPSYQFKTIPNKILLNEMNRPLASLRGKALQYAKLSLSNHLYRIDEGDEEVFNKVLWYAAKGNKPYPGKYAGVEKE